MKEYRTNGDITLQSKWHQLKINVMTHIYRCDEDEYYNKEKAEKDLLECYASYQNNGGSKKHKYLEFLLGNIDSI